MGAQRYWLLIQEPRGRPHVDAELLGGGFATPLEGLSRCVFDSSHEGSAVGCNADLPDDLLVATSDARCYSAGTRGLDDGRELIGDHEHRAPHAEHADKHPVLIERFLDSVDRRTGQPRRHGQKDAGRIGRMQRNDSASDLQRVGGTVGGSQAVSATEASAALSDVDERLSL